MLRALRDSLVKESRLIALIAAGFGLSLLAGAALGAWGPESVTTWATGGDAAQSEHVEKIFGRFREPVREGELTAIATAALIVFALNTIGSVMRTISSVFIIPLAFFLLGGVKIGVSAIGLHGSSFLSVVLFLLMVGLEWVTYVLSAAAGAGIGLALIFPARTGCSSRGSAFRHALAQAGYLYVVILGILAAQAVFEILYVRKVLIMGGTGVPLGPW